MNRAFWAAVVIMLALPVTTVTADPLGHVTGLGGVFVTSKDPKALAAWYRDVLGIRLEAWGGAILPYDAPGHPPIALCNAMPRGSVEIAPSYRDFMIYFADDDVDVMVKRVEGKGVFIPKRQQNETSRFASIIDPDGTKIELWQPPAQ